MAADDVRIDDLLQGSPTGSLCGDLPDLNALHLGGTGLSTGSNGAPGFAGEDFLRRSPLEASAEIGADAVADQNASAVAAGTKAPAAQGGTSAPSSGHQDPQQCQSGQHTKATGAVSAVDEGPGSNIPATATGLSSSASMVDQNQVFGGGAQPGVKQPVGTSAPSPLPHQHGHPLTSSMPAPDTKPPDVKPPSGAPDYASFKGEFQVHVNPSCLGDASGRGTAGPSSTPSQGLGPGQLAPGFGGFGGSFGDGPAVGAGLGPSTAQGGAHGSAVDHAGWPGTFPYFGGSGTSLAAPHAGMFPGVPLPQPASFPPKAHPPPQAASTETQLVCEVMRGVRDAVSQHVFPPPPSPMLPAFGQPHVMPHMVPARPCPAEYMGPGDFWWARPLAPEADRRRRPEPGRAGAPADRPERPEGPSPRSRADASVQAEPADVGGGPDLRRTFEGKLQPLRSRLLPDLRNRRDELLAAIQATDNRIGELRQRCEEAEGEAREEFESLRRHLSSHESYKLVMLRHHRDLRSQLIEDIDTMCRRVEAAGHNDDAMAAFLQEFPEIQATAESLRSRSQSLPHVEVSLDDVPFEARERADKLRRFAVMDRLHRAKDLCLWRLEQQRRQLLCELQDACVWLRHMEALLERYAESLTYVCYFCAERFSAGAANTRCIYNVGCSPRTGRPLAPDPRVPSHLWGAGVHFWVPPSAPGPATGPGSAASGPGAGAGAGAPAGEYPRDGLPGERLFNARPGPMDDPKPTGVMGASGPPSRSTTPLRAAMPTWWDAQRAAGPPPPAPWAFGATAAPAAAAAAAAAAPAAREAPSPQHQAETAFFDTQLRRIAQACEQRGVDIRSAFRAFDANGDGFLSPQEFRHALSQLRLGLSDDEFTWLVGRLDSNADGMVSYEEFLTHLFRSAHDPTAAKVGQAFVEHFATQDEPARQLWKKVGQAFRDRGVPLRQVFALFDANGDGVISREELVSALRLMQRGLSDADAERLVRDIDTNQDGKVSIHEIANRLQ